MTAPEGGKNRTPGNEKPEESETTQIFREAFGLLAEFGLHLDVSEVNGQTELMGTDEEPPVMQP
jgi:hypothetical protein